MMLLFWRSHIEKKGVIPDTVIPNKRFLLASLNCGQTAQSLGWYLYYASDTQHCSAMITQKSFCSWVVQKMCIMLWEKITNDILVVLNSTNRSVHGDTFFRHWTKLFLFPVAIEQFLPVYWKWAKLWVHDWEGSRGGAWGWIAILIKSRLGLVLLNLLLVTIHMMMISVVSCLRCATVRAVVSNHSASSFQTVPCSQQRGHLVLTHNLIMVSVIVVKGQYFDECDDYQNEIDRGY